MSAVVRAFRTSRQPSRSRPWQNHELAEFYRVIDILGRAGLGIIPDMGVSDEGEPWFAFCRADTGEVVVHCARIDGICIATSIAFSEIFSGNELRDVINSILRSSHFASVTPVADKRLYLHTAAVFTAFIAAALLFCKHAHAQDSDATAADAQPTAGAGAPLLKFLAAFNAALGEGTAGGSYPVSGADVLFGEAAGSETPISLAALMSAALLAFPILDAVEDLGASPQIDATPPANLDAHSSLLPASALSPLAALEQEATILQQDGSATGPLHAIFSAFTAGIDLSSLGNLPSPLALIDNLGQTQTSHPSFLTATENPSEIHFNYVAAAPSLHTATVAVMDQVTSAIQQTSAPEALTPAGHVFDLSNITPIALAVFLGTPLQANSGGGDSLAGSLPPSGGDPPAGGQPPTSGGGGTSGGDEPPASGGDAVAGGQAPMTTSSGDTGAGDQSTTTTSAGASSDGDTIPASATISSPGATDTSPTAANPSASDSSSTIGTPPTTVDPTASPTVTTPTTIVMGADPIPALEQLTDYALGNHTLQATLTESSLLATALANYTAGGAAPPVLVVFDSANIKLPMFEFSPGVFFVEDNQLGVTPAQASPADLVTVDLANGGIMTLLGVVEPTHAIF